MLLDLIPESAQKAGLGALMKGAGKITRWLPIPQPTLLVGPDSSIRLGQAIAGFGHRKLLIVTDKVLVQLGLHRGLTEELTKAGVQFAVFDEITPDAPIPLIERGIQCYQENDCDAIVAIGGGSSIDASKTIALAISNPGKRLRQLAGYFKGLHSPVPIYAVPTTAGTGSEVTVAAVVADPERQSKLVIVDTRMVPRMAALDPVLMAGLPPAVTAATGVDALTHAVEAFVGRWASPQTDSLALAAVGMVFKNLSTAYSRGGDLQAREQMALASTFAGMAFTRANVGYVHAIAHQFGGRYHTPHGLANAIVLPHVLRFSAPAIEDRLALLAEKTGADVQGLSKPQRAQAFLDAVDALLHTLNIPKHLQALRKEDIPLLARAALKEAHTGYPVPRYMTQNQCETLIRSLLPAKSEKATTNKPKATHAAKTASATSAPKVTRKKTIKKEAAAAGSKSAKAIKAP